jgi:hypothetical protein
MNLLLYAFDAWIVAILAPEAVVGWATTTGAGVGAFFSSSEELLDSDSEMS